MTQWREQDHPRHPAGSDRGGEFRDKAGGWVAAVATALRSPEQDLRDLIGRSRVVRIGRLSGGSMAETMLATLEDVDGTHHKLVQKTYGSVTGRRSAAREVVVAEIGRALGVRVPTTVLDPRYGGEALYMEYVEADSAYDFIVREHGGVYDALQPFPDTPTGRQVGLLDLLVNNTDRHAGNWLIDDGEVVAIDHSTVDLAGAPDWHPGTFSIPYLRYDGDTGRFEISEIADLSSTKAARVRQRLEELFERDDIKRLLFLSVTEMQGLSPEEIDVYAEQHAPVYAHGLLARWDAIAAMARGAD